MSDLLFSPASILEIGRISFRNLSRHRVKTIITATAVAISVALYIFVDGLLTGMNIDSMRNIVSFETGAAKIQTHLYFDKKDDRPMYENFGGWEPYAAVLSDRGYDTAPRFVFSGTLYSEAGSAPVEFAAVEPQAEARLLRYASYIESGRFLRSGAFELVLGTLAAEKLQVGIPQRPLPREFENRLAGLSEDDRYFIESLYERNAENGRYVLKQEISPADLEHCWDIYAQGGRNNVRISTVIDVKAAPEAIRKEKFEEDLLPLLSADEKPLILAAYTLDDLTDSYLLQTDEKETLDSILASMVRVDYAGAVRHINQLVNAVVVGVINSPDPAVNGNVGYLPLDVLQDEAGLMLEGRITELLIRKKNARTAELPGNIEAPEIIRVALDSGLSDAGLEPLPRELGVYGWQDYVEDYLIASSGDKAGSTVMILLLFILSFLGISNTMLMSILERTRETGMMRAMGMSDGQLLLSAMIEAGFVGLFGSMSGILIGCLINIPMITHGLDISSIGLSGIDAGYRVASILRSTWNVPVIIGTGVVATLVAALVAWFPTRRALKMPITETLRFE
jgi:ABC-type lipoprotein release transport system permease subunit